MFALRFRQQKRQECVDGSEKLSCRNSASDCNRTTGKIVRYWTPLIHFCLLGGLQCFLPERRNVSGALAVALSARQSVTSRSSVETAILTEPFFGTEVFLEGQPIMTVFEGNSDTSKIRVLLSAILSQTLDLEKFRHGPSTVVNLVRPTRTTSSPV